MARCVLIVDSETGKLVDVAGNVREGGRYRKFIGRMLSSDRNPMLDYGANGGSKLEISDGGYAGDEIDLKARLVNISGDLRVGGVTLAGTGKLDSEAAYPAWDSETAYEDRTVVSHIGRLWMADGDIAAGVEPGADADEEDNGESGSDEPGTWQSITIGDLIDEAGHGSGDIEVVPPSQDATTGQAADAKATGDALYTGFTEWVFSGSEYDSTKTYSILIYQSSQEGFYDYDLNVDGVYADTAYGESEYPTSIDFTVSGITATRHLVTPTKTSQLPNDGPSSGPNVGPPFATTNQIPAPVDISGKLDGAAAYPAWDEETAYYEEIVSYGGRLWYANGTASTGVAPPEYPWTEKTVSELLEAKQDALTSAQIAAVNSGATAAKVATWDGYAAQIAAKADAADIPYAMVERTVGYSEWSTQGVPAGVIAGQPYYNSEYGAWYLDAYDSATGSLLLTLSSGGGENATHLEFNGSITGPETETIFCSRYYGATLLDRANNLIDATTGNVTLILPPFVAGKVRDLLVACTIGLDTNDEPWSVIFQGGDGEAISFKAEGDDAASATFPVPDAAGDWWYSLTERAPHVFAVSLKQLQSVSQPTQTQGGS